MSKRNSLGSANTLFNYFSKTPPATANKKAKAEINLDNQSTPTNKEKIYEKPESKKRERQTPSPTPDDNSDEDIIVIKKRKRIRINPIDSDDSDTENKADNGTPTLKEKTSLEKKLQDSFKYDPSQSPQSRKSLNTSALNKSISKPAPEKEPTVASEEGTWVHTKLAWLKPDKIRDAMKRRPDHPDYNPRTLFVPPDFMNEQTPAHRQWWEMKTTNYDCVLFFKVGKFYELYHMDAAVGVNELGFSYMKGEFAHSGFPESAYSRMASTLVSKGYKVARIEQTETPDMMQERCKRTGKNTKWDKVVQREICQITCQGIQVCGLQDSGPDMSNATFLMSIAEEEHIKGTIFGVCFVDTSVGWIQLGQFRDDTHFSRLLTTIAHYPPALVVYDRKNLSKATIQLLNNHCHNARREPVFQAGNAEKTLKILAENYYKTNVDGDWPEGLKPFLHPGDALGLTPAENSSLALKALGGCVSYLTESKLDIQILGMSRFSPYSPPDMQDSTLLQRNKDECKWTGGNTMVLDAVTLKNLRIIQDEGCLYDKLNFCATPMGKRLLYQWVCTPTCNINTIKERQEAVKHLFDNPALCEDVKNVLSTLPDLERLLAKVHTLGNLKRSKHHPDSRAIFYEEKIYSKRKVLDFISVLNGFAAALKLGDLFSDSDVMLLRKVTQLAPDGQFPDYRESLNFFKEAFNQSEAEKEGRILPGEGVDNEYDETMQTISDIENELNQYLKEQEKYFKCRLSYIGSDKKRYQIEVPLSACSKADSDYSLEGTRKGYKRFSTAETKEFLSRMMAAEDQKRNVLKDLSRRIFEKFSSDYNKWASAVHCLSTVDVLMAIAEFGRQQNGDICLPTFTYSDHDKPYIDIVDGRHPCIPIVEEFIPNDTCLGKNGTLLILTGPNMGGKSTLMRQLGLITVLAHLGGHVPASRCALSPVDRVFTRVGARDDILSGRSTFLVEMSETAAILTHATKHSLILLDELGRGTSTHEGAALAAGVCASLARRTARTLLATHYHALLPLLRDCDNLTHGHMACMVETDETTIDNTDEIPEETITFLYKLTPGACPKSYGFNAARLAGVPREITSKAHLFSKTLEAEGERVRTVRKILRKQVQASDLRKMLEELSI